MSMDDPSETVAASFVVQFEKLSEKYQEKVLNIVVDKLSTAQCTHLRLALKKKEEAAALASNAEALPADVVDSISGLRQHLELTEKNIAYLCAGLAQFILNNYGPHKATYGTTHLPERPFLRADNIFLKTSGAFSFEFEEVPKWMGSQKHALELYWMAPEQMSAYPPDILKEAVWGIGICAYQLAEGFPPYFSHMPKEAYQEISNAFLPSPALSDKGYSKDFIDFVNTCLKKNLRQRPSVEKLLKHPFLKSFDASKDDFRAYLNFSVESTNSDSDSGSESDGTPVRHPSYDWEKESEQDSESVIEEMDLEMILKMMRDPQSGVTVKTRYYRLQPYYKCFVGKEAVDWLMMHAKLKEREEARTIAEMLMYRGYIHHVRDSEPFRDQLLFYRFAADEKAAKVTEDSRNQTAAFFLEIPSFEVDETYLASLVSKMTDPKDGISIKNRKYRLRKFNDCFVGREAVDWMMKNFQMEKREQAIEIGNLLRQRGIIHHVVDAHEFKDEGFFYRFYKDEKKRASAPSVVLSEKMRRITVSKSSASFEPKPVLVTPETKIEYLLKTFSDDRAPFVTDQQLAWLCSVMMDSTETEDVKLQAAKLAAHYGFPDEITAGMKAKITKLAFNSLLYYASSGAISLHREIERSAVKWGKVIGRGASANVFLAQLGAKECAIKVYDPNYISFDLGEFRRELALMNLFDHPNMTKCFGACSTGENLFIAMEYVEGGTLTDFLKRKDVKWTPGILLDISIGLLQPNIYMHEHGVIHRDLKTSNYLIHNNMQVKLVDFGISTDVETVSGTASRGVGTPQYIAPEVFNSEKYNESADVYSFAIVLWQLVTRKEPWADLPLWQIPEKVLNGERLPLPEDCPPYLRKMIKAAWMKNPYKRPSFLQMLEYLRRQKK